MNSRTILAPRALSTAVLFAGILVGATTAASALMSAVCGVEIGFEQAAFAQAATYDTTLEKDAVVRCASSTETGYIFGNLGKGAVVHVVQEVPGWARIATTGAAFDGWVGYVKAAPGITLSADGKSIKVSSRAEITAANSERDFNPDASYRAIGFLVSGDEATVTEKLTGDAGATYYTVSLGTKTSGWISTDALTPRVATTAPKTAPTTTAPTTTPATTTAPTTAGTTPGSLPGTVITDASAVTPGTRVVTDIDTETGQEITTTVPATDTATTTTATTAATTAATTTTPAAAREDVVAKVRRVRVSDLNNAYKTLRAQPTETAEFEALRERCLAIAEDPKSQKSEIDSAKFLAQKVAIDITIQTDLRKIAEQRRKLDSNFKGVADLELATLARMPYDNVGRLNASKFYTGERMPLLYVLQDQGTGYTIAYIVPGETTEYSSMLGLLVGVKGPVRYDESLRLNVIAPTSIVPITAKTTTTTATAPAAAAATTTTATGAETATPTEK